MKKKIKSIIALFCTLVFAMGFSACTTKLDIQQESEQESSEEKKEETIENIDLSYIYFGSYPQKEIVQQASYSGVYGKDWGTENDYIIDANLYNLLSSLSEDKWNVSGDTTVENIKYRRVKASAVTNSVLDDANYYSWSSTDIYHYFKYETIKWRVLKQNGNDIFLLSEIVLDDQKYNTKITNITWETSTIRSWLNGYDSSNNLYGTDYSNYNFIDTAFSTTEQSKINITTVENKDSIKHSTEGGNDTNDKIFLLSEEEVYGDNGAEYGFSSDYNSHDAERQSKSSTYAKAMGVYASVDSDYLGNCDWWIRSPGSYTGLFDLVMENGRVYRGGQHADSKSRGIRPAMHIAFDSTFTYS